MDLRWIRWPCPAPYLIADVLAQVFSGVSSLSLLLVLDLEAGDVTWAWGACEGA